MEIVNQYSILWAGLIILGLTAFFILRKGVNRANLVLVVVLGAVLIGGWFIIRPDQASMDEINQFQAVLGQGQPLLLELQSPF